MNYQTEINVEQNASVPSKTLFYSWVLIFTSAFFLVYKYVLQTSPSVITHELMNAYSLSGASLGLLAGMYFYTYMIMQIPAGILLDKYSIKKLTALAIALCTVGAYLFYYTSSYDMACFARAIIGFGAAFATVSYMKLASLWFEPKRFSLLSGFFGSACMGGAGMAELVNGWLAAAYGWKNMLLYSAIIGLALLALFMIVVKDKSKPKDNNYKLKAWEAIKKTLSNKHNYPLIFYSGFSFIPVAVFGGLWGVPYLEQAYSLTKSTAATSASLVFFGFAIGGPLFGLLSDRLRKRKIIVIYGTICSLVFLSIVLYVPNLPYFLANLCLFLFGFFNSVFLISYTMGKEINPLAITATVIAVINTGDAICGAIAEPLVGKLLDLGWNGQMINNERIFSTYDFRMDLSVLTLYIFISILFAFFTAETNPNKALR